MDWEEFRYQWSKVLADTPGLEEAVSLLVEQLCSDQYQVGWDEGNEEGYEEGYDDGFDKGRDDGYTVGYEEGCEDCRED